MSEVRIYKVIIPETKQDIARLAVDESTIQYCNQYINVSLGKDPDEIVYSDDWIAFTECTPLAELTLIAPLFSSFTCDRWGMEQARIALSQLESSHCLSELASFYRQIFSVTAIDSFQLISVMPEQEMFT